VRAWVESGGLNSISDRELRVLLPTVASSSGDGQWTLPERREVRSLLRELGILQSGVIASQRKLVESARKIRAYLVLER
jgi:hypothetical protein